MNDRSSNLLDNVTPTAFVALAAPHTPLGRDLPVVPGSRAAEIRAGIDAWDGRIPTAPKTATLTREQLDREIAAAKTHEPYLIGYGGTQANAAFGGAA